MEKRKHNLEAKLEKVEHAIKSRTDDVVDFKQKTAYEIMSGDWSSDVCSSDLREQDWQPVQVLAFREVRRL